MTSALPVTARLAWWGTAWLRGQVSPDDLLDAVLDGDVAHLVAGEPLLTALAELRSAGATGLGAALPREGAPVGLGGPADFNAAAIEQGEALVAVGAETGWVPRRVGPTVEWSAYPAARRQVPDVGEADRELRGTLLTATAGSPTSTSRGGGPRSPTSSWTCGTAGSRQPRQECPPAVPSWPLAASRRWGSPTSPSPTTVAR